jgi:hypothetical protein
VGGVLGAAGGTGAAWFHYKGEIGKLREERETRRAQSFDRAKTGYRVLYREFADHYDAGCQSGGWNELRTDFRKAQGIGFRPLNQALRTFWPEEALRAGKPPAEHEWENLSETFQLLLSLSLHEWDERQSYRGPEKRTA